MSGHLISFGTNDLPVRGRMEAFRELYGHAVLDLDVDPIGDDEFKCQMSLRALPTIGVGLGSTSAASYNRTRELARSDDFFFGAFLSGHGSAIQRGREVSIAAGEGVLLGSADVGATVHPVPLRFLGLSLRRDLIASSVPGIDDLVARQAPPNSEALRLLIGYAQVVQRADLSLRPEAQRMAADHLYDLIALVLGATKDAHEVASRRGLRSARLRAVRETIEKQLTAPSLNAKTVAIRLDISPRYIRSLFAGEGTTFSDYVAERRLALAHRMLLADRFCMRPIADIAYCAGFNDLSHFSRAFRRRYDATPSDVRAQALAENRASK